MSEVVLRHSGLFRPCLGLPWLLKYDDRGEALVEFMGGIYVAMGRQHFAGSMFGFAIVLNFYHSSPANSEYQPK